MECIKKHLEFQHKKCQKNRGKSSWA